MTRLAVAILLLGAAVVMLAPRPALAEGYRQQVPSDEDIGAGYAKPNPTAPEPRGQMVRVADLVIFVAALALAALIIHHRPGGEPRRALARWAARVGYGLAFALPAGAVWWWLIYRIAAGGWRWQEAVLIGVGVALLSAIGWMLHRNARPRTALVLLLAGVLVYFGFYRGGCVCPIGATQNVALSLADPTYTISIVITLLFLLPLAAALFLGRVFCGGVCWLGATQDVLLRKPVRVPLWLDKILRWGRWVYLGLVLYWVFGGLAIRVLGHNLAVEQRFLICEYDPFVNLFRSVNLRAAMDGDWLNVLTFAGPWWMWTITGIVVGSAVFIGRPYCRWLCPYGALLGVCSRPASKPVTVMPDACCDCGLCEKSCPLGAIENHAAVNSSCLACARCYDDCPLERERLGLPVPEYTPGAAVQIGQIQPKEKPAELDRPPGPLKRMKPADDDVDVGYVDELVARLGRGQAAALPILQAIQSRHHYLPTPALRRVVEGTSLTMAQLVGLATFYNQFRLAPIGEHLVRVCHGTACHVAGARRISDAIHHDLGIGEGEDTDAARRFTTQEVACLGCCSLAPVVQVDDATFGHLTTETAVKAIRSYQPDEK